MTDRQVTAQPGFDPRELALQLAVVVERLDERSAHSVSRLEQACAAFERSAAEAAKVLATERSRAADDRHAAGEARNRMLWVASAGLLAGALVATAGAMWAVGSAKRELASVHRDQALLDAINSADVTRCGDGLCARLEPGVGAEGEYRRIAPR